MASRSSTHSRASSCTTDESEVAMLRAKVQHELQSKKRCSYQPYECSEMTHDRYMYCLQHILCDKTAPFKQCTFVHANGKRCSLPAPKTEKKEFTGLCSEHALKSHLQRSHQTLKQPPPRSAEVLLHSLSHYVQSRQTHSDAPDDDGQTSSIPANLKATQSLNPFHNIRAAEINAACSDILDQCSESESDVEASTYSTVWQDAHADSSDNESIDSENGDLLKHANVYSFEEITSISKDKLVRLQSLYMEQFHHLNHMLREHRRKYIHALKRERETCCSISNQLKDNLKEQRMYKKLKAYNRYHKRYGIDAILVKRENELRMKVTDGVVFKPHTFTKCAFSEGGVKCTERALPVARHCRKHILEDPNQVLFRKCGKTYADVECPTPIELVFEEATCQLHRDIPVIRSYAQIKKDSDSDNDENSALPEDVKVEDETNASTESVETEGIIKVEVEDTEIDIDKTTTACKAEEAENLEKANDSAEMEVDPCENGHIDNQETIVEMENDKIDVNEK